MIVVREFSEVAIQVSFTEYDHVIQTLPANAADQPLDIGSLPRRPGRREHLFDTHGLHVVVKEGPPSLRGRLVAAHQVLTYAGLADVDTELEQLAMNPRSAPEWVLAAHGPNQLAHLFRHGRPPRLTVSDLPGPEQAKAFPVPADDGRCLNDEDAGLPVAPDGAQPSP